MLKYIVEGWSKESCEKAILDGLEKAEMVTSKLHNPHVSLKDLQHYPEKGSMAQLEISTEAVGMHEDKDLKDAFEHTMPGSAERFRTVLKEERERFRQLIANHFARLGQFNVTFYIPDFILVPLGGADIDNNLIETELAQTAEFAKKQREKPEPRLKAQRHDEELEPE